MIAANCHGNNVTPLRDRFRQSESGSFRSGALRKTPSPPPLTLVARSPVRSLKKSGKSTETLSKKFAGRFSIKFAIPSLASSDWPRDWIDQLPSLCASTGWAAPAMRQTIGRANSTETGEALSAISRAIVDSVGSRKQVFGTMNRTDKPPFQRFLCTEHPTGKAPLKRGGIFRRHATEPRGRQAIRRDP